MAQNAQNAVLKPMDFNQSKPIYRQIIDLAFANILSGEWPTQGKVPSVRELAASITVNSHTVLKAYEFLQQQGIIESRRGMGFFLTADAPERVRCQRRQEFFDETLPAFIREMKMLGITFDELREQLPPDNK